MTPPRPLVVRKARTAALVARYTAQNRCSRDAVTAPDGPTVSLTTHGARLRSVHLAIESIAVGRLRPGRLVLWLDEETRRTTLPPALTRLERRGLELRSCPDWGPHKKYFGLALEPDGQLLVTADDDWFFPHDWLATLVIAAERHPTDTLAHRVRRIAVTQGDIAPYDEWTAVAEGGADRRHVPGGGWGLALTPDVLAVLADEGDAFAARAPRADDLWLHRAVLRAGRAVRPVSALPWERFVHVPEPAGSRPLRLENVDGGGNDRQLRSVYEPELLASLVAADEPPTTLTPH
ncbi:hypothetical protein [Curtobacterium caseinilyticum]|uniref:Glycosyltransferase n=1 Tax=Curtobacterium caseinilyticum TaxID=3055137 RepID=A0ABT7TRB2_9MICO|nr:hypothetical protein [Curtobacterium caseinilyticum]MDM7892036.1 hypothetical protein [Curtobacterium caseinilyticum]